MRNVIFILLTLCCCNVFSQTAQESLFFSGIYFYKSCEKVLDVCSGNGLDKLDTLIRREPNNAGAYFVRGSIYSFRGHGGDAIADFTRVIELEPNNAQAYIHRGEVKHKLADYKGACLDGSKALELEGKDPYGIIKKYCK